MHSQTARIALFAITDFATILLCAVWGLFDLHIPQSKIDLDYAFAPGSADIALKRPANGPQKVFAVRHLRLLGNVAG